MKLAEMFGLEYMYIVQHSANCVKHAGLLTEEKDIINNANLTFPCNELDQIERSCKTFGKRPFLQRSLLELIAWLSPSITNKSNCGNIQWWSHLLGFLKSKRNPVHRFLLITSKCCVSNRKILSQTTKGKKVTRSSCKYFCNTCNTVRKRLQTGLRMLLFQFNTRTLFVLCLQ